MFSFKMSRMISMAGKVLILSLVFLLVLNLSRAKKENLIEIPTVEIVHAESAPLSHPSSEAESESIREKEKILENFIVALKEREKLLDLREKGLDVKRENLELVKRDINKRLEELTLVKGEIEKVILERKALNKANITKLAKVYESTPPEQAGPMLSGLDADIAATILLKMNNMKAGKIWGFVAPEKAVLISKELAKYNGNLKLNSGRLGR